MAIVISFYALELLIVAFGVFLGYRRSTGRSLVRLSYLIVIGILSVVVSRLVAAPLSAALYSPLRGMLKGIFDGDVSAIFDASPELDRLLIGFVGALCIPIVFSVVFGLLQALTMICQKRISKRIVRWITHSDAEPTKGARFGGAAIGLVSSVLVVMGLFAPIYEVETIASQLSEDAVHIVEKMETPAKRPTAQLGVLPPAVNELLESLCKLPAALRLFDYTDLLTLAKTPDGVRYRGAHEAGVLANAAIIVVDELDHMQRGEGDEDMMHTIGQVATVALGELSGSDMSREIMVDVVRGAGNVLQSGGSIGGIDTVHGSNVQNTLMKGLSGVLANTDKDNLAANMKTLVGLDLDGGADNASGEGADATPDVKTEAGAIQYLAKADITNTDSLMKDSEKCGNLVEAIYTVSENPNMDELIEAVGDVGNELLQGDQNPLKNISKETAEELHSSIHETLKDEASKGGDSALKDVAGTLKDSFMDTAAQNNVLIDESQAELGAICVVSEFFTPEMLDAYLNDPNFSISYEEVMAYLGID